MKKNKLSYPPLLYIIFLFFVTYGFKTFANPTTCLHTKTNLNCVKYLRNYDGDTISFNISNVHPLIGENISVRVRGIDTPEIKTKNSCEKEMGRNAKKLAENLLKNAQRIDLVNVDRDKYFRILADVNIDGKDLKSVLIKNQLAYEYDGGTKKKLNWCQRVPAQIKNQ
jgi:micrococcal nuclease